MAFREALLAEFDHEMAATLRMIGCTPNDAGDWKPHERSRTFASLTAHIVEVLGWSAPILEQSGFDLDARDSLLSPDVMSMPELRTAFADTVARARRSIDRSEAELTSLWRLSRGGDELFVLPRAAAFRTFVLSHVAHHRGQLSVYLRLRDIAVPATYGPTADSAKPNW